MPKEEGREGRGRQEEEFIKWTSFVFVGDANKQKQKKKLNPWLQSPSVS